MKPDKPIVKIVPIQTENMKLYRLEIVEGRTLLNIEQAEEFIEQLRQSITIIKMAEEYK